MLISSSASVCDRSISNRNNNEACITDQSNLPDAYRPTVTFLLKQNLPSSFTLCTGASGHTGTRAGPGITQGALFSLAATASRELEETNVRFVEVLLWFRVEVDESAVAAPYPAVKSSEFARVYERILGSEIKSQRVKMEKREDIEGEFEVERTFMEFK